MNPKHVGLASGVVLLGVAIVGISCVSAQPPFRPEPRPNDQGIGRFQVVQVVEREIIILDTATGDLYAAGPKDIKPFSTKPVTGRREEFKPEPPERQDGFKSASPGAIRELPRPDFRKKEGSKDKTEPPPREPVRP